MALIFEYDKLRIKLCARSAHIRKISVLAVAFAFSNTKNRVNHQINGISPSNKLLLIYMEAGRGAASY